MLPPNGDRSIPLELKVLMVLRMLGSGLMFNDAAEMTGYMSTSESNRLCILSLQQTFCPALCSLFSQFINVAHINTFATLRLAAGG
jgi:hypothetical protein